MILDQSPNLDQDFARDPLAEQINIQDNREAIQDIILDPSLLWSSLFRGPIFSLRLWIKNGINFIFGKIFAIFDGFSKWWALVCALEWREQLYLPEETIQNEVPTYGLAVWKSIADLWQSSPCHNSFN